MTDKSFFDNEISEKEEIPLLNELYCNLTPLENTTKMLDSIGLLNLMIDYNLTWKSVYQIVKESIEEVERGMKKNDFYYYSLKANLTCSNGQDYTLIKSIDGRNITQVCSKHTAREIVDELNNLAEDNERLKEENQKLTRKLTETIRYSNQLIHLIEDYCEKHYDDMHLQSKIDFGKILKHLGWEEQ